MTDTPRALASQDDPHPQQPGERGGILRELATRATPGPWTTLLLANGADVRAPHASGGSVWVAETRNNDDAAYIAAVNPTTVLRLLDALDDAHAAPIDMVLFCPNCGLQHVDAQEPAVEFEPGLWHPGWDNPPHKSHLCHRCGHIWRPADVPTNGVLETKTRGANDSFSSMLGVPPTAAKFDEFFDHEYPDVEDRQGKFRNSNGYQLCWRGWEAATARAAAICRGVNNHDNPMTANDCADEIEKGLEP